MFLMNKLLSIIPPDKKLFFTSTLFNFLIFSGMYSKRFFDVYFKLINFSNSFGKLFILLFNKYSSCNQLIFQFVSEYELSGYGSNQSFLNWLRSRYVWEILLKMHIYIQKMQSYKYHKYYFSNVFFFLFLFL